MRNYYTIKDSGEEDRMPGSEAVSGILKDTQWDTVRNKAFVVFLLWEVDVNTLAWVPGWIKYTVGENFLVRTKLLAGS